MQIETRYNIGDEVFLIYGGKEIKEFTIDRIVITETPEEKGTILYDGFSEAQDGHGIGIGSNVRLGCYKEDNIFRTRYEAEEELIKRVSDSIRKRGKV